MNSRLVFLSRAYQLIRCFLPRFFHDYESVVLFGHHFLKHLGFLQKYITHFLIPPTLETPFHRLTFSSPLILAAFESDPEIVKIWSDFGLGGATLKTILRDPRPGNPRPRLFRVFTPEGEGLVNAMGLPGKGVANLISSLDALLSFPPNKPLGFSIGGNSLEEYKYNTLELLSALSTHYAWKNRPYFIEINISCPNTPEGQNMLSHPDLFQDLLRTIKARFPETIIGPKLSPNQPDDSLLVFGQITQSFPLTFLTLGNAQFLKFSKMGIKNHNPKIDSGALSGPALYSRTLEMTRLLAPFGVPIIATGGISTVQQVCELQSAGATLIGMTTAIVQNPYCVPMINDALKR